MEDPALAPDERVTVAEKLANRAFLPEIEWYESDDEETPSSQLVSSTSNMQNNEHE